MSLIIGKKYIHQRVKMELLDRFVYSGLNHGDKLPTITEIAKLFDVSRTTAIKAVEELVNEGVLESTRGRGIRLSRIPRRVATDSKTVLAIRHRGVGFSENLKQALIEALPGYQLFETQIGNLDPGSDSIKKLDELVGGGGCAAFILSSVNRFVQHYFQSKRVPAMVVGELEGGVDLPNIAFDEYERFYQATRFVLECGYKNVTFIQHRVKAPGDYLRRAGVMAAYNEMCSSNNFSKVYVIEVDEDDERTGKKDIAEFLDAFGVPVGFVSGSDISASWLLHVAREKGFSVPKEVGVVSNGNTLLPEHTHPMMTCLRYDDVKLGFETGSMLTQLISGYDLNPRHVKISFEHPYIIVRETTITALKYNKQKRGKQRKEQGVRIS